MNAVAEVKEEHEESLTLDQLFGLVLEKKEALSVLSKQEKLIKDQLKDLETTIIEQMQEQGLTRSGNDQCLVRINKQEVPQVTDWEQVYQYVGKTGNFQLFQKRLASKAWDELNTLEKDPVPGIELFEVTKLSVTKAK